MARLWLLDFDGTLIDSEKAIKACYLSVTEELIPKRSNFIETMIIGPTLDESSKMILTDDNLHMLDAFKKRFQKLYDDKIVLETLQYPGVDGTLKKLRNQGDHLCIVTNKRAYPTKRLINYYGWNSLFIWIACLEDYPKAMNKYEMLLEKKIDKKKYSSIYLVGDTFSDGKTANLFNIPFIKAAYGYGEKENWSEINIFKEINNFEMLQLI